MPGQPSNMNVPALAGADVDIDIVSTGNRKTKKLIYPSDCTRFSNAII
jgi:hypothetical protein